MEKAKEQVQENLQHLENMDMIMPVDRARMLLDDLKPKINALMWENLPSDITMDEAEVLAMTIFDIIHDPRKYLTKN